MQTDRGTTAELGISANVLTALVFFLTTVVISQHAFLMLLCPGRHIRSSRALQSSLELDGETDAAVICRCTFAQHTRQYQAATAENSYLLLFSWCALISFPCTTILV
jgi:hypothetical protein